MDIIPKGAIVVQETTEWDAINHIYILNSSKSQMYGYMKAGTNEVKMFEGKRGFDARHRTFKTVELPKDIIYV